MRTRSEILIAFRDVLFAVWPVVLITRAKEFDDGDDAMTAWSLEVSALTIDDISQGLRAKQFSAVELTLLTENRVTARFMRPGGPACDSLTNF